MTTPTPQIERPALPERAWSMMCTKCGRTGPAQQPAEVFSGNKGSAPCARCGYAAFVAQDPGWTADQMHAYLDAGIAPLRAENEAQAKRIAELEAARGLQPIETAPRDGTYILIMRDGSHAAYVAQWGEYPGNPVISAGGGDTWMYGWVFRDPLLFSGGCDDGFLGWEEDVDAMPTHWIPLSPQGVAPAAREG